MKTTTEGDIPELFQQFNGNSANYQELTRAAAARASQARWPLLSAVELEQGDIPAVMDSVTGLAVVEPMLLETPLAAPEALLATQAAAHATSQETAVDEHARPVAPVVRAEVIDEIETLTDSLPEMPHPIVLPGNTIFMAPAPYSARHFAQLERKLVAHREAALAEIVVSRQDRQDHIALENLLVTTQDIAIAASVAPVASADAAPATPIVEAIGPLPEQHAAATPIAPTEVTAAKAPVTTSARVSPTSAPAVPEPAPKAPKAAAAAKPAVRATTDATPTVKHAGLQPLFQRLAEPEESVTPVMSLFSRLMQS